MGGGTQTNSTVITALLRPYEGVIAGENTGKSDKSGKKKKVAAEKKAEGLD